VCGISTARCKIIYINILAFGLGHPQFAAQVGCRNFFYGECNWLCVYSRPIFEAVASVTNILIREKLGLRLPNSTSVHITKQNISRKPGLTQ
jgi:hypothetical protein